MLGSSKLHTSDPVSPRSTASLGTYYTHERANNNAHPLLDVTEPFGRKSLIFRTAPLGPSVKPFQLAIASPRPKKPIFVDYHSATFPVVSDKVRHAIEPLVRHTIEFVPARLKDGENLRPFWIMHAIVRHDVIDLENSDYSDLPSGPITWIDKLVIDNTKLSKIPLENRRLFLLGRTAITYLWHEDVVKALQQVEPTGIRFFPAQGYGQDAIFTP